MVIHSFGQKRMLTKTCRTDFKETASFSSMESYPFGQGADKIWFLQTKLIFHSKKLDLNWLIPIGTDYKKESESESM